MTLEEEVNKIIKDEDAAAEVFSMVAGFDNWYWDVEDYRQDRLPDVGAELGKLDNNLVESIGKIYDINEEYAFEDGEPFPLDVVKEGIVDRLAWSVENWDKWYPAYKIAYDQAEWLERSGLNDEAYYYSDYGDDDKSPGIDTIYMEENLPHGDVNGEDVDLLAGGL